MSPTADPYVTPTADPEAAPVALRARNIRVSFGGLRAVNDVSIAVEAGTIAGLIGPNGAGKTTLFDVITGLLAPDTGTVSLAGADVTALGVHRRARLGLARTFQRLEPFNSLSARDNVLVAAEQHHRPSRARSLVDDILDRVGLGDVADITVGTLPTGTARLVELARALASEPKVLLLDEASSGLTDDETQSVGELLRRLVADDDLAVLLVEHDMGFVMDLCERLHVLDFGVMISSGTADEVQRDPLVRTAYLGPGDGP